MNIKTIKNVEIVENILSKKCDFRCFSLSRNWNVNKFSTIKQGSNVEKSNLSKNPFFLVVIFILPHLFVYLIMSL